MGVTIETTKHSVNMGYGGFGRFRMKVAEMQGNEFGKHYARLYDEPIFNRKEFFEGYNKKTEQLIKDGYVSKEVANFCYQSDCGGYIDKKQAKIIYELIRDCDELLAYGYIGRDDCTTMKDMKDLFFDCFGRCKQVRWW